MVQGGGELGYIWALHISHQRLAQVGSEADFQCDLHHRVLREAARRGRQWYNWARLSGEWLAGLAAGWAAEKWVIGGLRPNLED